MQVLTIEQAYVKANAERAMNGDVDKLDEQAALDAIKAGADAEAIWMHGETYSDAAREFARMWFEYGTLTNAELRKCGFNA